MGAWRPQKNRGVPFPPSLDIDSPRQPHGIMMYEPEVSETPMLRVQAKLNRDTVSPATITPQILKFSRWVG